MAEEVNKEVAKKPKSVAKKAGKTVKVTQVRSGSRCPRDQVATLKGLGLNKINRSRVLEDTSSVRGMINKVRHLIIVSEEA